MNQYELKANYEEKIGGYFFSRSTMRFFGDTMANYYVLKNPVDIKTPSGDTVKCWVLTRRKAVKNGLRKDAYFSVDNFTRVSGKLNN
jgi:hypothetical protein